MPLEWMHSQRLLVRRHRPHRISVPLVYKSIVRRVIRPISFRLVREGVGVYVRVRLYRYGTTGTGTRAVRGHSKTVVYHPI
jgi:hypothetical protein